MGRYRNLADIQTGSAQTVAHLERAAINTPIQVCICIVHARAHGHVCSSPSINTLIQGGAADIMTLAMLKIERSERLHELGYRLLLQIHDEVILEGPEEHAAAAKEEVMRCMQDPFDDALPSLQVCACI